MKKLIIILASIILFGCATYYQPQGFKGGYSEQRLQENVFKVTFRGNGYTSQERVMNYLLYRCAEVAVRTGFDFFVIIGNESGHRTYQVQKSNEYGQAQVWSYRNTATGNYQGTTRTTTYNVTKHRGTYIIQLGTGEKPNNIPDVYDARELLKYMQIKRSAFE